MPNLIDVHSHLQFAAFDSDCDEVIQKALKKGIWVINSGSQKQTSKKAIEIAGKYPEGVYASVGLHPIHTEASYYDIQEFGEKNQSNQKLLGEGEVFDYSYYKELGLNPKTVAIGECGLDYNITNGIPLAIEKKEKQKDVFIAQIKLANEIKKPLVIHCRNANQETAYLDLINILKQYRGLLLDVPGAIHFFSGSKEDADILIKMGFYFSFGGIITFSKRYAELADFIPLERTLLESDAPYVAPKDTLNLLI
ncbi:MAG: TatD family hydrolase [Candidatus Liptonbacteria bacterium]|nr:TatD family hydrolase [Candidatus Liptonbacteria bacterium]